MPMKVYNLVLGRFLEASVCVTLYGVSVASLRRESTDSLIYTADVYNEIYSEWKGFSIPQGLTLLQERL